LGKWLHQDLKVDVEMNESSTNAPDGSNSHRRPSRMTLVWCALLFAWFLAICLVPDPRPLGAPEWAVKAVRWLASVSDPMARAFATIMLRGIGLAGIGVLLVQAFGHARLKVVVPVALAGAPLLAVLALWINYTFFPIAPQVWFATASGVIGVLLGLAVRRKPAAWVPLVIGVVGLFVWGTSTGISDDLYEDAQATGLYLLEVADEIPAGDAGFERLMSMAFAFAEDNAHGRDVVVFHRAAILALGAILGQEKVVTVAKREINLAKLPEAQTLRHRITLYGRRDLSQHFWVSAALAVLSDESQSMTVGLAKEMMDSAGGSGFSFVDLTADRAGTLFAVAATRDEASARAMQMRIRGGVVIGDFVPNPLDLPEGLSKDDFHAEYGGLGGEGTQKVVDEIRRRLEACQGLW
jgi:hypothetical protein